MLVCGQMTTDVVSREHRVNPHAYIVVLRRLHSRRRGSSYGAGAPTRGPVPASSRSRLRGRSENVGAASSWRRAFRLYCLPSVACWLTRRQRFLADRIMRGRAHPHPDGAQWPAAGTQPAAIWYSPVPGVQPYSCFTRSIVAPLVSICRRSKPGKGSGTVASVRKNTTLRAYQGRNDSGILLFCVCTGSATTRYTIVTLPSASSKEPWP
jgi:hypothetical protein